MAGNVTGLHVFAADVSPEALSLLDGNFNPLVTAFNTLANFSNYYVDTGAVNALVVTTTAAQVFTYADGVLLQVKVGNTTTITAPTINVNGLGAKTIVNPDGTALAVGVMVAGAIVGLQYSTALGQMELVSGGISGSGSASTFVGTLTGMTGATTGTVNYVITGKMASIYTTAAILGTSNATAMTMTGLPAVLTPANGGNVCACSLTDNGIGGTLGAASVTGTTITFYRASAAAPPVYGPNNFTNSGNKGVVAGWMITYPLA